MENINHIEKLRKNFQSIIFLINEFNNKKISVQGKLHELKNLYQSIIKTNNSKLFLFCLDSFFFQYKCFQMDMEHMEKKRLSILNRVYCDYYKLYQLMIKYMQEHQKNLYENELEKKTFPVYKDLEPLHEYELNDIIGIHDIILSTVKKLTDKYTKKEDQIDHYYETHKVGFSISNFLNTLKHENRLLQDQIELYMNYISFFHVSQKRQMKVLHEKMNYFEKDMIENINMNHAFSIQDIEEEDEEKEEEDIISPLQMETQSAEKEEPEKKEDIVVKEEPEKKEEIINKQVKSNDKPEIPPTLMISQTKKGPTMTMRL